MSTWTTEDRIEAQKLTAYEPVALIKQSKYGTPSLVWNCEFKYSSTVVKWDDIPLYTHPVKHEVNSKAVQLSDEEIESIYYKNFNFEDADMVQFARAIIKEITNGSNE